MNPQRYLMPVIIAAGLHGALVYCFSDSTPPMVSVRPERPAIVPDWPRIEVTAPPPDSGEAGIGQAEPLPSQPDIPRPAAEDIFSVNVTPAAESIRPVVNLPAKRTGLVGPDVIGARWGRPSLPDPGTLDRVPRATVRPAPAYPGHLRSTNGSVTVEFVVDTAGRVVSAEALRWTHRDFVEPTVQAVLRWRFEPGTIKGRKVNFRMAIPVEFVATN
jgi:TonB family protein